mmetsp:Transcript_2987/g.5266  ORF Transcript_2987/g.5266 Transcript_2987/m.5266 type:complete len:280 (-) Transcript_2987:1416-2255(-)
MNIVPVGFVAVNGGLWRGSGVNPQCLGKLSRNTRICATLKHSNDSGGQPSQHKKQHLKLNATSEESKISGSSRWTTFRAALFAVLLTFTPVVSFSPLNRRVVSFQTTAMAAPSKTKKKDASKNKATAPVEPLPPGKLDPQTENKITYGVAGVVVGLFALKIYRGNRREEEEEAQRIKEEVERLEKWKQEFFDETGEVADDDDSEDLMAEFRKRVGQVSEESRNSGSGSESDDGETVTDGDESESEVDERDMLKRMWDAPTSSDASDSDEKSSSDKDKKK